MHNNVQSSGWTLVAGTPTGDQGTTLKAEINPDVGNGLATTGSVAIGGDLSVAGKIKGSYDASATVLKGLDTLATQSGSTPVLKKTITMAGSGTFRIIVRLYASSEYV